MGPRTDQVSFNALEIGHFARTLAGCFYGNTDPAVDIPWLLEQYRAGRLDLAALVSERVPLAQVGPALARLGTGARSVIVFPD
jgi:S-(hydroxymethyl)glutathione dehydrogenase/alcohol dehydrogenase